MNDMIQRARDIALNILKPSQCEIEHGMQLHQNSVVCEAYGFAPRAAVDGDAVRLAIEQYCRGREDSS
jgi:membrane dipeptidase